MALTMLKDVLEELHFLDNSGLVMADTSDVDESRNYVWQEIRGKLDLDAVFFHGNAPVVYFKEFQSVDNEELWGLHRSLWNYNRGPLLIAIFPNEVRVYNCFAQPTPPDENKLDEKALLKQAVWEATDTLKFRKEMSEYRRWHIELGKFGLDGDSSQFDREQRVDSRLLENLRDIRDSLIKNGLEVSVTNSLLGRSIFICYLFDRGIIGEDFFGEYAGSSRYVDLLRKSLDETYQLFERLAHSFNGDLFPVTDEEKEQVKSNHLERLSSFLEGTDVVSGQQSFWPYDFKYIPVEFISAIYETFLGDEQKEDSAFYTPSNIVDYVLNEVFPLDLDTQGIKILDPACGSGIFLVEAFRRLVINRYRGFEKGKVEFRELKKLLEESIYGVDTNKDAIQVAAFSCYLTLLEFLEPSNILDGVRFPVLKNRNLFVGDFFNTDLPFDKLNFDIIVGNPPWRSELTNHAVSYVKDKRFVVGDKQIAQAFLWRVSTLLSDRGRACLLAPSKSTLFNRSKKNLEFRRRFFTENQVTRVVDLSLFRNSLFQKASFPAIAVFFQGLPSGGRGSDDLEYWGPHPSPLSEILGGVVIYGDEVKQIFRSQVAKHPYITWKMAMWGTARDFILIDEMSKRGDPLGEVCEDRGWIMSYGATVGNRKLCRPELNELRFIPARKIDSFRVSSRENDKINCKRFERPRCIELFRGPVVLIRGVLKGGRLASVFMPDDALFLNTITGISGRREDTDDLKVLCAYLNSSIVRYYLFLTSSTWGVERGRMLKEEYEAIPFPKYENDSDCTRKIVSLVDKIQEGEHIGDWTQELDGLVFDMVGATDSERQVIKDFLEMKLPQNHDSGNIHAFRAPALSELEQYAESYREVFTNSTGGRRGLSPVVYKGSSPYRAVSFRLEKRGVQGRDIITRSDQELDNLLVELGKVANEQLSQGVFLRRNLKVYHSGAIHIVKPAERRFWTTTSAYNDADNTIAQVLRTSFLDNSERN